MLAMLRASFLSIAVMLLIGCASPHAHAASWSNGPDLPDPIGSGPQALLMGNGRVLAVASDGMGGYFSAELHTGASGLAWTRIPIAPGTEPSPTQTSPALVLLADGRVLMAGGVNTAVAATAQVMVYDPAGRAWDSANSMSTPRANHALVRLADGRVLVIGGDVSTLNGPRTLTAGCEIYDPSLDTWSATGALTVPRANHAAILLPDGHVLVSGGVTGSGVLISTVSGCERFDPASGTWSSVGAMALDRSGHTLTLLPDGGALAVGGYSQPNLGSNPVSTAECERFSALSGTWTVTASMSIDRSYHGAMVLGDGRILVAGGYSSTLSGPLSACEIFDPISSTWTVGPSMSDPRTGPALVRIGDGRAMAIGGSGTVSRQPSTEVFTQVSSGRGKNYFCGVGGGSSSILIGLPLWLIRRRGRFLAASGR